MTTFTPAPLPFPAVNNSWASLTLDQVLKDITVAHQNVVNCPNPPASGSTSQEQQVYWGVREVQAGLFVAAHKLGATQAQVQAATGK